MANEIIDGPAPEQPLHKNCRCIMVPILIGDIVSAQSGPNYHDWFERQNRATKIDLLGPARYKEYLDGAVIKQFIKDNRIMTLKELKIDRISRQQLFDEIYKNAGIPEKYNRRDINKLYNDKLTSEELVDIFKKRYSYFELDIVDKMPKEKIQLLLREYDLLLQQYPVGGRLVEIKVDATMDALGKYIPKNSAIYFQKTFVHDDIAKIINTLHTQKYASSNNKNHVYIHEFAHVIDHAKNKNGKIGRQLLLAETKKRGLEWIKIARKISSYAGIIPKGTLPNMYGGEYFSEAFTAWRNGTIDKNDEELAWIIDFFSNLSL